MSQKHEPFELIGQKFYLLTIKDAYRMTAVIGRGTRVFCDVKCDCGTKLKSVQFQKMKQGQKKSCGCLRAKNKKKKKRALPPSYSASSE